MRLTTIVLLSIGCFISACGPAHIRAHTPRERRYDPGKFQKEPVQVSDGSLWQDLSRSLVADFRASNVGDLVTIRVDESPSAEGDAATQMSRQSSMTMGAPDIFGFTTALARSHPDIDPQELIDFISDTSFSGSGETSRGSRAEGDVAVRVKRKLPNGNLFLEGTKIIMVNDEELHIYVSGVIRPEDIEQDNTVLSSLIADAQIEFTGRGYLTENQEQGWFTHFLSIINPF